MKQIFFKKTKYNIKSLNDDYSTHFKPISKHEVISMQHSIPQQGVQCLYKLLSPAGYIVAYCFLLLNANINVS